MLNEKKLESSIMLTNCHSCQLRRFIFPVARLDIFGIATSDQSLGTLRSLSKPTVPQIRLETNLGCIQAKSAPTESFSRPTLRPIGHSFIIGALHIARAPCIDVVFRLPIHRDPGVDHDRTVGGSAPHWIEHCNASVCDNMCSLCSLLPHLFGHQGLQFQF